MYGAAIIRRCPARTGPHGERCDQALAYYDGDYKTYVEGWWSCRACGFAETVPIGARPADQLIAKMSGVMPEEPCDTCGQSEILYRDGNDRLCAKCLREKVHNEIDGDD